MPSIKDIVLDRVIEEVVVQMRNSARGWESAIEDAKEHKGKLESRYDTFLEEAQYLASGHAKQVLELNKQLSSLRELRGGMPTLSRVATCALVEVEDLDDQSRLFYFLLPFGGGGSYEVDSRHVVVISAGSVIARSLKGSESGDEVTVRLPDGPKRFRIISLT